MKYKLILALALVISIIIFMIIIHTSGWTTYRLGDIISCKEMNKNIMVRSIYKTYFKDSIASKYLENTKELNDYDTLYRIIKEKTTKENIPSPNAIIIHLRLGDVLDIHYQGNIDDLLEGRDNFHYLRNYEYFDSNIAKVKDKNIDEIIIVGNCHRSKKLIKTEEYITKIKKRLNSHGYKSSSRVDKYTADEDFLFMANSTYFIMSGGGYSKAVSEMVKRNNKYNLSDIN